MEKTKKCTKCGKTKPISAFSKHRHSPDGHAWQCKDCNAKRARRWRKTPEGIYVNLKSGQRFYNKKPFNLTRKEFLGWYDSQPKNCIYCGIPETQISKIHGSYIDVTDRLTVDCKINEVGYQVGNMVLACHRCNFVKSNIFSFKEMIEIGQKYVRPKWEKLPTAKGGDSSD